MSTRRAILVIAIVTVLSATVLLLAGDRLVWLRAILGIPLALLLPGHAAMLCADPDRRLGGFEWFALSVAASIAIVALATIGVAATIGISEVALVVVLTAVTLAILSIALVPAGTVRDWHGGPSQRSATWRAVYGSIVLLACAALVLLASLPQLIPTQSTQTVQLWGLPDAGSHGLRIGVNNVDATSTKFRVTIQQSGHPIADVQVVVPKGTERILLVKPTALWSANAPLGAVLTDPAGLVSSRSISVWDSQ